jgi:DNA-binding transcriptional MerR regulator
VYDASVVDRLAVIELAKLVGFNPDQIAAALNSVGTGEPGTEWRSLVQARRVELDEEFRRLALTKQVLAKLTGSPRSKHVAACSSSHARNARPDSRSISPSRGGGRRNG